MKAPKSKFTWIAALLVGIALLPIAIIAALAFIAWKNIKNKNARYVTTGVLVVVALALTPAWIHALSAKPTAIKQHTSTATVKPQNDNATDEDANSKVTTNVPAAPSQTTSTNTCDSSLWSHVYHPSRLKILDNCKTVSGTIEVVRHEKDGDYHILLKLDSQYANLINSKNTQYEQGDLVLEPVCEQVATQSDAVAYCQSYHSNVVVPAVGTHVTVVGAYVFDSDHGWNEIHPVTSISAYTASSTTTQAAAPAPTNTSTPTTTTTTTDSGGVIKMSSTGICHAPGDAYYDRTTNYTPYPTMQACIDAGGRPSSR